MIKYKNFNKCIDKNGYLLRDSFYHVIKYRLGGWQLGGVCPFCHAFHMAIIKCEDYKEYDKVWHKVNEEWKKKK
jgi:hypothetical protein